MRPTIRLFSVSGGCSEKHSHNELEVVTTAGINQPLLGTVLRMTPEHDQNDATEHEARRQLEHQLLLAREHIARLELEVLNARDDAYDKAIEVGDLRNTLNARDDSVDRIHLDNHLAHIARLEDALEQVQDRIRSLSVHRHQLDELHVSTTWKLGWRAMTPIRLFKTWRTDN